MNYCVFVGLFLITSTTSISAISPALLLTPLINQNRTQEARNQSLVNPSLFLNLTSHSGFLTVDERYQSNTFFWFFPVANKPVNETPWIIWLQGGPGGSSVIGLFDEIGPFEYKDNALKLREWSWAKDYSILFVDNPIGAGYSFTNSDMGFARDMATYSNHLYSVLQQFLKIFPELRSAPLYIAGESYAGRYVPAFAAKIQENNPKGNLDVNLQGLIMGNPALNRESFANYTALYYQWGLVDTQGALAAKSLQDEYTQAIRDRNDTAAELRTSLLTKLENIALQKQDYNILVDDYDQLKTFIEYLHGADVKEAIHVGNIAFSFSNNTVHKMLVSDFLSEIESKIQKLLDHYRILIYCGQLDMLANCVPSAEVRRKNWQWSLREQFMNAPRQPWWYNESVAGYVKSGGRFTEVLVRGSGHLVPIDKPAQAHQLISYFIRGLDLPVPPEYTPDPEDTPKMSASNTPDSKPPDSKTHVSNVGVVVSAIINVILVFIIIGGIVFHVRWRRKNEAFFYSATDRNSDDIFLS